MNSSARSEPTDVSASATQKSEPTPRSGDAMSLAVGNDPETIKYNRVKRHNYKYLKHFFKLEYWGLHALIQEMDRDLQRGIGPLWGAVLFAAGLWFYYSVAFEPHISASASIFVLACVAAVRQSRRGARAWVPACIMLIMSGVLSGQVQTRLHDGPRLSRALTSDFEGRVVDIEERENGATRLWVSFSKIDKLEPSSMPSQGRVTTRAHTGHLKIGDTVTALARLMPLPGAVYPGGYDFGRSAFFSGIDTVGFTMGDIKRVARGPPVLAAGWLETLRHGAASRIQYHMGDTPEAALAIALLVGERGYLEEEDQEALRMAGLAHLLAISGLHMSLVAALVFFSMRHGLALFREFALTHSVHRLASFSALTVSTGYLLLSGASVATQRAYIMVVIVLLAGVMGRWGLSLRSLGLAAFAVLLVAPHNLIAPGFQMSFAAVAALLAVYTLWRDFKARRTVLHGPSAEKRFGRILKGALAWFVACGATSLIAEAAIGPIAAYHFQKVAPYGLVANLAAMPVFSFAAMPFGLIGLLAMPMGAEGPFLQLMSLALSWVLWVAHEVERLTGSIGFIGMVSGWGTFLMVGSILALGLLPGRFKVLTFIPIIAAGVAFTLYRPPDILVSDNGRTIAFHTREGEPRVTARRASFVPSVFLKAFGVGDAEFKAHRASDDDQSCDDQGCVMSLFPAGGLPSPVSQGKPSAPSSDNKRVSRVHGLRLAMPRTTDSLLKDCRFAEIIVTTLQAPETCSAELVIDAQRLARFGSHALWLGVEAAEADRNSDFKVRLERIQTSYRPVRRPWEPEVADWARGLVTAE